MLGYIKVGVERNTLRHAIYAVDALDLGIDRHIINTDTLLACHRRNHDTASPPRVLLDIRQESLCLSLKVGAESYDGV